ncbi:helicase domain protein [Ammonifex degensii KC4]|uniref:Helicase domain protein n=1 Tax=Ammonifex degensii (strain DSM 10501 / KC4) TaxID=429009 RepID=C9R822_AMMDK|nr:helicase-related protein [Ammonifex degensii]ACX52451.1 helicase domain protein [Ammonifex degensii KC4]
MGVVAAPGSIVRCRGREWVVLPSSSPEVIRLRPLVGDEEEECGVYRPLVEAGLEKLEPAAFPLPAPEEAGEVLGVELLWNAARLLLRDGATPLRCLGRISVRPRAYQLVPLLMALRLDPVRILIADDVGVGKTIEALLIARELLDRGEIDRVCVLCPPYLCDQWQRELAEKFHIHAEVVRSGTVSRLERGLPPGEPSIFSYYEHLVVSIDYAKSERHRADFLIHCPRFVIVDEAHGAAQPGSASRAQQQRHELLKALAADPGRHLVLLTATPHSGIEESFVSLLALLRPSFARLSFRSLTDKEREEVARHFVQRRRPDIARWLGEHTCFPERESVEETYELSPAYRDLFQRVYSFSRELVRAGEALTGWRRRICFWAALSLLRCVMSSPAAAVAALLKQASGRPEGEKEVGDAAYAPFVYDLPDEEPVDAEPAHAVEEGGSELSEAQRQRLRQFARQAQALCGSEEDTKVVRCAQVVSELLREGYQPVVWCRYVATAEYVAGELRRRLAPAFPDLAVEAVTGARPEEDRRGAVLALSRHPRRVLVATDCLSEGVNLQDYFTAVVHYDLPWNPNRLEQREGRVDRFGQRAKKVKAVLLYGRDNPVDGAVLDVLLRKAREIRRSLGVSVPVPEDSESVMEAVLRALFARARDGGRGYVQLSLFGDPRVQEFHKRWDEAAGREKETRTRFAQRSIKPEEVQRELEETDRVLGDPGAVRRFVLSTWQRLGCGVRQDRDGSFSLYVPRGVDLPFVVRQALPENPWRVAFETPAPEGATYLGRNHPFVTALARYLLEGALAGAGNVPAARCGVVRTTKVRRRTVLTLLRVRYLLDEPGRERSLLAEEVLVAGFRGTLPDQVTVLEEGEALSLLAEAGPEAPVTAEERREVLSEMLGRWEGFLPRVEAVVRERARRLEEAHRRVRAAAGLLRRGLAVRPQLPPDLLGLLVLLPVPKGVTR